MGVSVFLVVVAVVVIAGLVPVAVVIRSAASNAVHDEPAAAEDRPTHHRVGTDRDARFVGTDRDAGRAGQAAGGRRTV